MRVVSFSRIFVLRLALLVIFSGSVLLPASSLFTTFAFADTTDAFSLQVSPSPLIATIKPGVTTSLDLQIRNTNVKDQALKMGLRSFSIDDASGQVRLGSTTPGDITKFVSFASPTFTVGAGQIYTQHVKIATPASAGFSYSFAITISQANPPSAQNGRTALQGSVAVFTLLNVDKPGATRKLQLDSLSVSKHVYEFLPATFTLKLHNSGNSLVQPSGTIFIQRSEDSQTPLASIKLNANEGYILPGTSRSLSVSWNDGVPHYQTHMEAGASKQSLSWSGNDISKLRFGRYVAKVVAVYDDGTHDVPITASVSFWVIPWRILFVGLLVLVVLLIGVVTIIKKSARKLPRKKTEQHDAKK